MNTNNNTVLTMLLYCLLAVGCKKDTISANGHQTIEVRYPGNFSHIHTSGGSPVFITFGQEYKVELQGSENLIARFQTVINGNELTVGYEHLQLGKDDVRVYVMLPKLRKLSLSGSATMELKGSFPYLPALVADISGSGDIKLNGDMESGETTVIISGSGDAELSNLSSENANFVISGSGNIRTGVTERLKASISGSGSVYYKGSPTLDISATGTGKVIAL